MDDEKKNITLRYVGGRWKDFKTKLVSGWISKTRKLPEDHKEPYEFYDGITQAQWETFKKNCETEEFKEISEKNRKNQIYNEHPHYLGQAGYAGKKAKWIAEGHNSMITLPSGSFSDRSIDWILARSKKGDDGNYAIPNEKTKIIADKMNEWREKANEGTWVPDRDDDVLNRALEKREHPGRVRGIGGTVGIKDVFGKIGRRNKGPSGVISADDLHVITQELDNKWSQRVETMVDTMVEKKIANILSSIGLQMPNNMEVNNTSSGGHRRSCQSVQLDKLQTINKMQEMDPYADLQKPTKCRLAIKFDSKIIVVGRGTVHPASKFGDHCHNQPMLIDHVRVVIDMVQPDYVGTPLPVPTTFVTTIGEAVGSFTQWPKSLVLLGDDDTVQGEKSSRFTKIPDQATLRKDKLEERVDKVMDNNENVMNTMTNELAKRKTIMDEEILSTLTNECRYLHDLVVQAPSNDNVINPIHVNKDLFTYDKGFEIHITMDDIIQFLSMSWLNGSWLQIYIMCLDHMCSDLGVKTIGFMCPYKLSQVRKFPDETNIYISNSLRALQSKTLLLAPHYEEKHCILLVFRMEKSEVYVYDPQIQRKSKLEIKAQVNMAFKTYKAYGGKLRVGNLKWKIVKCPQQSRATDCVYYVMRYMYDIVKNHRQSIDLHECFGEDGSYSQQDIDEVRDDLARYMRHNWM